jgi:hypothetical protein
MLTEQQTRDLLHLAADTVEVSDQTPVVTDVRRRHWPLVAAAASVVLVAGGVAVIGRPGDRTPEPGPPPAVTDDGRFRLGPDQVPSVFGYSADDAVALLEERGLEVTTKVVATAPPVEPDCGEVPGRAVGTGPGPGTFVQPGDEVVLEVSGPGGASTAYCAGSPRRDEAWALIEYAHDRGPAPGVADGVDLGPVLAKVREWSAEVTRYAFEKPDFRVPSLSTWQKAEFACGEPPARLRTGNILAITIEIPLDRGVIHPCHTVLLHFDGQGRIDDTFIPEERVPAFRRIPADVAGNSVDVATSRLEALGYTVAPIGRADCTPLGMVTSQQPYPEYPPVPFEPGTTVYLAFTDRDGPCIKNRIHIDTPAALAVDPLVVFATGGALPPVADQLDLYVGNAHVAQLGREQAADPARWPSPVLEVLASGPYHVTRPFLRDGDPCHVVTGTLPDELTTARALSRSASFGGGGEPETCAENWEAQLWLDDRGNLSALNVLQGDPAATE